jgi:uncharacterized membrane protein YhaH (DUF805 family)
MSIQTFLLVLILCGALLSAWTVVRFPRITPESGRGVTLALVACAVIFFAVPPAIRLVGVPLGALAAIFLVVLPAVVYIFLVVAWIMLFVRRAIDPYHP